MNEFSKIKGIVIGCPLPRSFFETTGTGENDHQIHAGSYHYAMQAAGIERANLIPYTSILPPIARKITVQEGMARIQHGAEMKVIQAAAHADTQLGEKRATSAILYGWLRPKDDKNAPHAGGLVCEYNGNESADDAFANLRACLKGLFKNPDRNNYVFADEYNLDIQPMLSATIEPKKRFGTALCALAFVDYFIPVLAHNLSAEKAEIVQAALARRGL